MKNYHVYLIMIINFIFQSTLIQGLSIKGVLPNTALILIVIISIFYGREKGLIASTTAGFLQDMYFSKAIGINLLIYSLISYGIGGFKTKLMRENILTPILLIFISTITYYFFLCIILFFLREKLDILYILKDVILLETLLNIGIGLIIYKLLYKRTFSNRFR